MTGAAPGRDYRDQCSPTLGTAVRQTSPERKTNIEGAEDPANRGPDFAANRCVFQGALATVEDFPQGLG